MPPIRFGPFEADVRSGELHRDGKKIRLQEQPFQVLLVLLERPGEVVSREELTKRLWPGETFVDFERGLNKAITRLRDALGDSAETPQYVETLPRRGYRFIAPVELISQPEAKIETQTAPRNSRRIPIAAVIGAAAISLMAGVAVLWRGNLTTAKAPRVLRYTRLTNDGQVKIGPLVTDGPRIYFNEILPGPRHIVSQVSIHGGEVVPVSTSLKQPVVADASEDGTELLLANAEEDFFSFWIQPIVGGSAHRLGTVLGHDAAFGASAGNVIYGTHNDVYSIGRDESAPRKLFTAGHVAFAFRHSPDRRSIRFSVFDVQLDDMSIMESATDGSNLRKKTPGCWGEWTADGHYFIFQDRQDGKLNFWTLPERRPLAGGKHTNQPTQLTAGPLDYEYPLPSKDGRQIFALGTAHRAELIRYDQRTRQFAPFLAGISAEGVTFSGDGKWIAYTSFPEGILWRSKVDGSEKRQLTFPPLRAFLPRWSPSGEQIVFSADVPTKSRSVYTISIEGGTPRRVLASEQSQTDANWSPDGNQLVFGTLFVVNAPIYVLDERSQTVTTLAGSNGLFNPQWSPDGKFIAAVRSGGPEKLMLFDIRAQKWNEMTGFPIGYPTWSHDGKYIYFQFLRKEGDQEAHQSIGRVRLQDRKIEKVVDVKDVGRMTAGTFVEWFGLGPDDSPLFARDISTQEIYALDVEWP